MSPSSTPERPQERPRVGYLGPEGTFSEEALLASATSGSVEPVPLATIYDAVLALREGDVRWSVAPIENSLDGSVAVTLDLLVEEPAAVRIAGEAQLRVRHSLIAARAVELARIETVVTHPQVPGQCVRLLRGELAHARVIPASSTAEAVRMVAEEGRDDQAALGTTLAARIYGATVLREGVEDRDDNETRFVWLARAGETDPGPPLRDGTTGAWKTSIVFWGAGAEHPGWLVRCLEEFSRRDINLTRIESRTRRERLGRYMFFADLAGHGEEESLAEAIETLRGLCEEVRVLGSYPGAVAPATLRP
jgi:prephenate dehydratase